MSKFTVPPAVRRLSVGALAAAGATVCLMVAPGTANAMPRDPLPQCGGLAIQASHQQFNMNLGGGCWRPPAHHPPNGWQHPPRPPFPPPNFPPPNPGLVPIGSPIGTQWVPPAPYGGMVPVLDWNTQRFVHWAFP